MAEAAGTPAAGQITSSTRTTGTSTTGGVTTTTASTSDNYKTEFVKVYQDAGVVGAAMLTLLALCLLLGLFCTRLIKMYTTLTASRDAVEAARSGAIEKLTMSVVLLRSENTAALSQFRAQGEQRSERIAALERALNTFTERSGAAHTMLVEIHTLASQIARESADDREQKLQKIESLLAAAGSLPHNNTPPLSPPPAPVPPRGGRSRRGT